MYEPKNVTIDVSFIIGNLTMNLNKVTEDIVILQEISKNIILDKQHAEDFIRSLNKFFAVINECSTE